MQTCCSHCCKSSRSQIESVVVADFLALKHVSNNIAKLMVPAHACHKCVTFTMNFAQLYNSPIPYMLHRCAASTIRMVWRTCRFGVAITATFSQCMLGKLRLCVYFGQTAFACSLVFKNRALTNGCGDIYTQLVLSQWGSRSRNHGLPIYTHVPNVIAMFSYCLFVLFSQSSQNENAPFATRDAPRRSRSRNIAVRNVCRAPFRDQFSWVIATFEIRYVFNTFGARVLQTPVCVASGARRACDAWSAGFQDVVSLCNRAG